jgi:glycosyltransferase involved in cell wall biosynthesis/tetratricopeptide (TPR) repeat protein
LFDPDQRTEILQLHAEFVRLRPQIVHLWQDRTSLVGSIAAALAGVPKVLLSARSTRPRTRQRYRNYMQRAYRALLAFPQIVLSNNSQAGARDYADWLDIPPDSIEVIWNGFDFNRLLDPANTRLAGEARAATGIPADALVVGGVFRIAQVKRPILWAETAARVLQHLPTVHFVIAGDGPLRDAMAQRIETLGIADRVHFLGHVDVNPWYHAMDVLLLTSETEGLPNVVIEAHAVGVPVVSTRVGGILEIISEGRTGHTADGNPDELAGKIIAVLSDRSWRETARREAARSAQQKFSAESMVQQTLQVYAQPPARTKPQDPPAAPASRADAAIVAPAQDGRDVLAPAQESKRPSRSPPALQPLEPPPAAVPSPPRRPAPSSASGNLLVLGRERFTSERLDEAREIFAQVCRLEPENVDGLRWLARTLRGLREHAMALTVWRRLLRLQPADREAHIRIMEALVRTGLYNEAIGFADRALRAVPDDTHTLRLLAQTYKAEGRIADALAAWNRLLALDPNDFEALFRAGEAALGLEDEVQAEAKLRAAADHPRQDPRPALLLARHWSWIGRLREARKLLRQALIKQPRHPDIWQSVFELLRVAGRRGLAERVLSRVRRALTRSPTDREFYAELLLADGRIVAAREEFGALVSTPETSSSAIRHLAALAFRQGDLAAVDALVRDHQDRSEIVGDLVAKLGECRTFMRAHGATVEDDWRTVFLRAVGRQRASGRPRYRPEPGVTLHILNSLAPGGTERQCATVASHQARRERRRRDVWVVRTDPRNSGRAVFFLSTLQGAGVHTTTLSEFSGRGAIIQSELEMLAEPPAPIRGLVNTHEIAALVAAIETIRPQVVQAWTPQCCAHAAIASLLSGVPRTVLRGGSVAPDNRAFGTEGETARSAWLRDAIAFGLADPAITIVNNCRSNLDDWLRWLGLGGEQLSGRAAVVPNLLDTAALKEPDPARVAALARDLGIAPRTKVVGGVMRLEREKDPQLWIAIAALACARNSNLKFVLVGDGRLRSELERDLVRRGLHDRVIMTGTLSEQLGEQYGLFDVLLLTSHFEGLPNVVLESQFYGVPVVAPRVGGIPEALSDGETGLIVDGRDPASFAVALASVLDDAPRRRKMSAAARAFVTRFNPDAVLDALETIYLPVAETTRLDGNELETMSVP